MKSEPSGRAALVLANGLVFEGLGFGAQSCAIGEAVFATGMTGCIETLTDPSYFGQIITQTFPLVGNYGIIPADYESSKIHAKAYIVRDPCDKPSNFRCQKTLDQFLKENNIPGLCGIDTRALTKVLREAGVMNAMLISGDSPEAKEAFAALNSSSKKEDLLQKIKAYKIENAVQSVSLDADKIQKSADQVFEESAQYRAVPVRSDGTKVNSQEEAMKAGRGKKVVLWDFGAKANIRRELLKRGLEVQTVSCDAKAEEILALKPDGIMLSNGPGDPADNVTIIEELKKILDKK
ncbi:MAG: carbamoyl phosphate synthase small subunit, partial [Treponema sp.]|nr:carbamoyl phosphate synthase small subunit [Treponema sp.]